MRRYGNIRKNALTALLFIVLEAAALLMLANNGIMHRQWAMRSIIETRAAIFGTIEGIGDYFRLKKTNDSLAVVCSGLLEELYAQTGGAYRAAEDTVSYPEFSLTPAKIVKGSFNRQQNYLILDKGRKAGIEPNMGVITDRAVVGVVQAVTENYSYVLSFLSPEINISARLGHSGVVGTLSWNGKGTRSAVLSQVPLHTEIPEGDTIYTSGFSNLYPSGIPIGTVLQTEIVDGASLNAEIRLMQEFRSLDYVNIARNTGKAEIDSLI